MPRRNNKVVEKPKNFKESILRIIKELKPYRVKLIVGIIVSVLSTILTIISPNKLSNLTDEISLGLKINTDNFKFIIEKANENYLLNNYEDIVIDGNTISYDEQMSILNIINNVSIKDSAGINKAYNEMPDSVKEAVKPVMNMDKIYSLVFILISFYLFGALFDYVESLMMSKVSIVFARDLRTRISEKINRLPLKFFDKNAYGDILSKVTNDVDTVASSFNQSLSTLISAIVMVFGILIMMIKTNLLLAGITIVSTIIGFVFVSLILSKSQKYFVRRQTEIGKLNGHIEEIYGGIKVIRTYNAEEESTKKFDECNYNVYEANKKSQFLSGLMHPLMKFIGNFGYVAVCITGAILASHGTISFGVIIAFITYVRLFSSPLTQIAQTLTSFQSASAAAERVFELIDEEELVKEVNTEKLDAKTVKGNIEFKNVKFTYDGKDYPTINNFSAYCKAGSKIAIVGPTGAGKTTMVNLLMRFYEIDSGSILIDGVDIKNVSRANIHDLFTMVLQDTWLFDGTIKENLVFNRKNISMKSLTSVCETVGIDHYIKTLSKGYDSKIGEAEIISVGQKQLLTICRAMLSSTPFVILDEATANVDTRTEELVQNAMDNLTKGRTAFIIAHRLSTIKNADLILVMQKGNIVESGNHEELLEKKGFYYDLYNSQFLNK